jgi:hypothetical protein
MKNSKLLVVVDESPATRKALQYVAQMAAGRPNFRVCLAHSLLSPPRQLVELRGAEKGRIQAYKSRWIAATEMTEQRALERANAILRQGGLAHGRDRSPLLLSGGWERSDQGNIETRTNAKVRHRGHWKKVALVARRAYSRDPAEEFVRQGKGFTIWVVE